MLKNCLPKYWLFLVVLISSCGNRDSQELAIEEIYGRWEFQNAQGINQEFWITNKEALLYSEETNDANFYSYRVSSDTVFLEVSRGAKKLIYDFFVIISLNDEELELSNAGHRITLRKVSDVSSGDLLEQFERRVRFE
mgnify:CR=1 FL=1